MTRMGIFFRRVVRLSVARNKEFFRDRGSMAWNFIFPFLVVGGFAFAYSGAPKPNYTIGVYGLKFSDEAASSKTEANEVAHTRSSLEVMNWKYVRYVAVEDLNAAIVKVERHQLDLLLQPSQSSQISPQLPAREEVEDSGTHMEAGGTRPEPSRSGRYWVNSTSPKGYVLERMLVGTKGEVWERVPVEGQEVKYVDWLLPGVLGLNMTFSALFGVGYVIVRYRKNGVLKRLKATPLSAFEFLSAQVLSRLTIIGFTTAMIFLGCKWVLGIPMRGSWLDLAIVFALGAFCMISIGVLIASRVRSEELAGGLLNIVTWPMMFFSGIWFSLEGLNPLLQKLALIFPLTHMLTAARAVMIDGTPLSTQAQPVLILLTTSILSLLVGAWAFRWE